MQNNNDINPNFRSSNFECPHCRVVAQQAWVYTSLYNLPNPLFWPGPTNKRPFSGNKEFPYVAIAQCINCNKLSIWGYKFPDLPSNNSDDFTLRTFSSPDPSEGVLLYPSAILSSLNSNSDMPEKVEELYNEAARVASLSLRSAAMLLRGALQFLIEHITQKPVDNLYTSIKKLNLPEEVEKPATLIRLVGNSGAHNATGFSDKETEDDVRVLFKFINSVTNHLITYKKGIIYNVTYEQQVRF